MEHENNSWLNRLKHWAEVSPDKLVFKEAGKEGLTYQQFYQQVCNVASGLLRHFQGKMLLWP